MKREKLLLLVGHLVLLVGLRLHVGRAVLDWVGLLGLVLDGLLVLVHLYQAGLSSASGRGMIIGEARERESTFCGDDVVASLVLGLQIGGGLTSFHFLAVRVTIDC